MSYLVKAAVKLPPGWAKMNPKYRSRHFKRWAAGEETAGRGLKESLKKELKELGILGGLGVASVPAIAGAAGGGLLGLLAPGSRGGISPGYDEIEEDKYLGFIDGYKMDAHRRQRERANNFWDNMGAHMAGGAAGATAAVPGSILAAVLARKMGVKGLTRTGAAAGLGGLGVGVPTYQGVHSLFRDFPKEASMTKSAVKGKLLSNWASGESKLLSSLGEGISKPKHIPRYLFERTKDTVPLGIGVGGLASATGLAPGNTLEGILAGGAGGAVMGTGSLLALLAARKMGMRMVPGVKQTKTDLLKGLGGKTFEAPQMAWPSRGKPWVDLAGGAGAFGGMHSLSMNQSLSKGANIMVKEAKGGVTKILQKLGIMRTPRPMTDWISGANAPGSIREKLFHKGLNSCLLYTSDAADE